MQDRDPYLDDGMRGFITNFARKNHWRVAGWCDLDDLVQDGYLCYYKIRRHENYRALTNKRNPTPDDVRQVMALVRTAFTRHVHALACKQSPVTGPHGVPVVYAASQLCVGQETVDDVWSRLLPPEDAGGACAMLVTLATSEVRGLCELLARDVSDAYRGFRRVRCSRLCLRETHSQRAARLGAAQASRVQFLRTRLRVGDGRTRLGRHALRETTNQMYCRLLGLSQKHDVRTIIRECLA